MFNWSPNRKVSLTFTKLNLGHLEAESLLPAGHFLALTWSPVVNSSAARLFWDT